MNKLSRIGVVLPCEGISDFPAYYQGDDANQLLAAWTTAWRPGLVATAGSPPEVLCSYALPEHEDPEALLEGALLLIPSLAMEEEVGRWVESGDPVLGDRWKVLQSFASRADIISQIEASPFATGSSELDAFDLEMMALGFAQMQVLLMTGGMFDVAGYDPAAFDGATVAAAQAAVRGDQAQFDQSLRTAYDQLETLRNSSYPLDVWLLDTVLVAETTLGERLEQEVQEPTPKSLRLTSHLAERIAASSSTAEKLWEASAEKRLSVVVGDQSCQDEVPQWSSLAPEAMADQLAAASQAVAKVTESEPRVFAPWSPKLPARLVQALSHREFSGLYLGGFDGEYPEYCEHAKAYVTAPGGVEMPAVTRKPQDLAKPETFLQWSQHLTETLQRDPVATLPLAGWAGCRHEMLDLLRCVARRSPVLGRFVTADEYFGSTANGERNSTPEFDAYGPSTGAVSQQKTTGSDLAESHLLAGLAAVAGAGRSQSPIEGIASLLGGEVEIATAAATETVALNPWSFARTIAPDGIEQVAATPGCGFAVAAPPDERPVTMVRGCVLRCGGGELEVEAASGGVRALRVPGVRGPLLSQRIVVGTRRDHRGWVAMRATGDSECTETATGTSITSRGDLLDRNERPLAKFEQTVSLDARRQQFVVRIALEPNSSRSSDRWFATRFMLRDDDWRALRSVQWRRMQCDAASTVAGDYYELQSPRQRVSFSALPPNEVSLIEGAPIQVRRHGNRTVDLILADSLEEPVETELVVGFGDHRPLQQQLAHGVSERCFQRPSSTSGPTEGWWLHVDTPNVIVSRIEPQASSGDVGNQVRVHLIETDGRPTTSRLRLWRAIREINLLDNAGAASLDAQGGVGIEVPAHGWLRIDLSW